MSKSSSKPKSPYNGAAHTPSSSKGLGDYYGTGITAKIGTMRDDSMGMVHITPKELKTPPRSLA